MTEVFFFFVSNIVSGHLTVLLWEEIVLLIPAY